MMKFTQHHSSSKGNLYVIELASGNQIIIDPGVPFAKLKKAMKYDLSKVVCCLLSHEHLDHSKSVVDLLKAGIPVYASQGTLESLHLDLVRNANIVKHGVSVWLEGLVGFYPFSVEHDATEPFGFYVCDIDTEDYLFYAVDLAFCETLPSLPFSIIAIECSFDKYLLEQNILDKKIYESVAKRLLDSHMEFSVCLDYLKKCNLSKCQKIHLLHCSKMNLDIRKAKKIIEQELFIEVVTK